MSKNEDLIGSILDGALKLYKLNPENLPVDIIEVLKKIDEDIWGIIIVIGDKNYG